MSLCLAQCVLIFVFCTFIRETLFANLFSWLASGVKDEFYIRKEAVCRDSACLNTLSRGLLPFLVN